MSEKLLGRLIAENPLTGPHPRYVIPEYERSGLDGRALLGRPGRGRSGRRSGKTVIRTRARQRRRAVCTRDVPQNLRSPRPTRAPALGIAKPGLPVFQIAGPVDGTFSSQSVRMTDSSNLRISRQTSGGPGFRERGSSSKDFRCSDSARDACVIAKRAEVMSSE